MRAAIVTRPIDPASLLHEVASTAHGAAALFIGTVRDVNEGRAVIGMEYAAYETMAAHVRAMLGDVRQSASRQIVEHDDLAAIDPQQTIDQVAPDKACTPSHEDALR